MKRTYSAAQVANCYVSLLWLLSRLALAVTEREFSGQVVGISERDTISVMHNGRSERIPHAGH
jgi:hypothetical protein